MHRTRRLYSTDVSPRPRRPSLAFRTVRIAALTVPVAAASLYLLDRNDGSLTPVFASDSGPSQPQALTLRAANTKLRREQQTQYFPLSNSNSSLLGRVDITRLPSNAPTEDEYSTSGTIPLSSFFPLSSSSPASQLPKLVPRATSPWTLFGVYDGHAGWATSAYLRANLLPAVGAALGSHSDGHADALKSTFLAMDARLMQRALDAVRDSARDGLVADPRAIAALAPAVAGSCALVAAWNSDSGRLLVACTGDSRAVLGRRQKDLVGGDDGSARYVAEALSVDQAGSNPDEVARLDREHPNEPEMLKGLREKGRIFGLMVTRAFGDHRLKFDTEVLKQIEEEQFGSGPRAGTVSQPYLTAEPEVTETIIQRGEMKASANLGDSDKKSAPRPGDFVILASDGLWDHISSEDAVHCVQQWIEAKQLSGGKSMRDDRRKAEVLHADHGEPATQEKLFYLKEGFAEWTYNNDWFVAEDDNAATHLVRNVLGGKNRGFFCGLLSTYAPMSRNVRDDITVQVIFFGGV